MSNEPEQFTKNDLPEGYIGKFTDQANTLRGKKEPYAKYDSEDWTKKRQPADQRRINQGQKFMKESINEIKSVLSTLLADKEKNPFYGKTPNQVAQQGAQKIKDQVDNVENEYLMPYDVTAAELGVTYADKKSQQNKLYALERELFQKKFGFVPSGANLNKFRTDFKFPTREKLPNKDLLVAAVLDGPEEEQLNDAVAARLGKKQDIDSLLDLRDKMGYSMSLDEWKYFILSNAFTDAYSAYRRTLSKSNADAYQKGTIQTMEAPIHPLQQYVKESGQSTDVIQERYITSVPSQLEFLYGDMVNLDVLQTWLVPELISDITLPNSYVFMRPTAILPSVFEIPVVAGTDGRVFIQLCMESIQNNFAVASGSTSTFNVTTGARANIVSFVNPTFAYIAAGTMEGGSTTISCSIVYTPSVGFNQSNSQGIATYSKFLGVDFDVNSGIPNEAAVLDRLGYSWQYKKSILEPYRSVYVPYRGYTAFNANANEVSQLDSIIFTGCAPTQTLGTLTVTLNSGGYPTATGAGLATTRQPQQSCLGEYDLLNLLTLRYPQLFTCTADQALAFISELRTCKSRKLKHILAKATTAIKQIPVRAKRNTANCTALNESMFDISFDKLSHA